MCDSASTATALFCGNHHFLVFNSLSICFSYIKCDSQLGIKSNFETSGVDSSVPLSDCEASLDKSNHADSILKWAQDSNMKTGFVTTTRYFNFYLN